MNETKSYRRKYHFLYKTTCLVTNKWYIGIHSTNDLDDGYLGSGKRLRYSINKYGKNNHIREILEYLPSRKALKDREAAVVTEQLLSNEHCMNLVLGGDITIIERSKDAQTMINEGVSEFYSRLRTQNIDENAEYVRACPKCNRKLQYKHVCSYNTAVGKNSTCRHCANMQWSEEAKRRLKERNESKRANGEKCRIYTPEGRAKLSIALSNRKGPGGMLGKHHTLEAKEKIAQRSRLPRPNMQKKAIKFCKTCNIEFTTKPCETSLVNCKLHRRKRNKRHKEDPNE